MSRKVINVVLSSNNDIEYLNISELNSEIKEEILAYTSSVRAIISGEELIMTTLAAFNNGSLANAKYAIIYPNMKIVAGPYLMSIKDILIMSFGEEAYNAIPHITEEEFYDITLPTE